ncbi:MAG: hypothetical protein AAF368_18350, partial [Planctomycetota bacterium]
MPRPIFTSAFVFCLPAAWLMAAPATAQERVAIQSEPTANTANPVAGPTTLEPAAEEAPPVAAGTRARALFYWGDFDGDGLADAYAVQPDGAARLLR